MVTDPHDGRSIGLPPPRATADVVLVSHRHFDHSKSSQVSKPSTVVVEGPGPHIASGIEFRGVRTYHDKCEGRSRGENTVFVFSMGGLTFCHMGDLGHVPSPDQAASIGPIDLLFIPVGGTFTIGAEEAWKVVDLLRPRVVVPMHYRIGGLSLSIEGVDPFLRARAGFRTTKVGNEIEFEPDDLLDELDVWIFTPE